MQYDPEIIAKYLWAALIAVVLVVAVIVVFHPGETRSSCSGFQYFVFLSQKMTPGEYSLELLNGVRDIKIKSVTLESSDIGFATDVNAGDSFIITSSKKNDARTDDTFNYRVTIYYDMSGIKDNRDSGICTGRVQ